MNLSRSFLIAGSLLALLWDTVGLSNAENPPNILIIIADDCTYNDLPLYGGENARTPNIDRLAEEGLIFERAYLGAAMCQPCRAELYTGLYPISNGCAWNHSASRPSVLSVPHYLQPAGYRVGITGKVHVKPDETFPFESVNGFDPNCVRNPTQQHHLGGVASFLDSSPDRPFCLVVALVEPHVPWVMGDASAYPPESIKLPKNIADTARTRQEFANYLAEITYMDGQVGEILKTLDESGQADNTLVFFTSEQGSQFPGNKWTTWDTGLHTALIARWPGRIAPNQRTDALVQYSDLLPTLLDAVDNHSDRSSFDGTSFLSVLLGDAETHRDYVYGIHNNLPEGPSYPTRTVSDGRYRYIRNLTPDAIYIEKHLMGNIGGSKSSDHYWISWVREAWNNSNTYRLVNRYMNRPREQLYDTSLDPYELSNRIDDPELSEVKESLSRELDRWMASQGDPGAAMDTTDALQAARRGLHLHGPQRQ